MSGPSHPDWELLDPYGGAMHFAKVDERETEKWRNAHPGDQATAAAAYAARKLARPGAGTPTRCAAVISAIISPLTLNCFRPSTCRACAMVRLDRRG